MEDLDFTVCIGGSNRKVEQIIRIESGSLTEKINIRRLVVNKIKIIFGNRNECTVRNEQVG